MSQWAMNAQAKAMELAQAWYGARFKTYRLTPMLQVTPADLPLLGIYILRERRETDQWNQAEPHFDITLTLGFSGGVHVPTDEQNQMSSLEAMMSELDQVLLEDPGFITNDVVGQGISGMDRTSQFAKVGETTLYEIRIEMTLRNDDRHSPRVVDLFERLHVTTKFPDQAHVDSGTPQIEREYELEQTTE